jgi:hypothetical protein
MFFQFLRQQDTSGKPSLLGQAVFKSEMGVLWFSRQEPVIESYESLHREQSIARLNQVDFLTAQPFMVQDSKADSQIPGKQLGFSSPFLRFLESNVLQLEFRRYFELQPNLYSYAVGRHFAKILDLYINTVFDEIEINAVNANVSLRSNSERVASNSRLPLSLLKSILHGNPLLVHHFALANIDKGLRYYAQENKEAERVLGKERERCSYVYNRLTGDPEPPSSSASGQDQDATRKDGRPSTKDIRRRVGRGLLLAACCGLIAAACLYYLLVIHFHNCNTKTLDRK